MKAAFVIPTKDRPNELRRMLRSIENQTRCPDQVIIVDGGSSSVEKAVSEFPSVPIDYLRCLPPSASRQRNMGMQFVKPEMDFVGFFDDDIVLDSEAVERMMDFWTKAPTDIAGAAFNLTNHPALALACFKNSALAERMGVYSVRNGAVLVSGFQTMIGIVEKNSDVDWISTGAAVWRRAVLENEKFDEWFSGYSYLEDLDFSYRIGKTHRLTVVAQARYEHFPASSGRGSGFVFGRREVRNRLYFVHKNKELSSGRCYYAMILRMFMSLMLAVSKFDPNYLARASGNLVELLNPVKNIPAMSSDGIRK